MHNEWFADLVRKFRSAGPGRPGQPELPVVNTGLGLKLRGHSSLADKNVSEARKKLGLPLDKTLFGVIGQTTPLKRYEQVIGAFSIAQMVDPKIVLVLAGSCDEPHFLNVIDEIIRQPGTRDPRRR